jgi:hypothetical protein
MISMRVPIGYSARRPQADRDRRNSHRFDPNGRPGGKYSGSARLASAFAVENQRRPRVGRYAP